MRNQTRVKGMAPMGTEFPFAGAKEMQSIRDIWRTYFSPKMDRGANQIKFRRWTARNNEELV